MLSNNSKCNSPIESADPIPPPPYSVIDDSRDTGNALASVSLGLGINASLFLIGDLFFRMDLGFSIIRSAVCVMLGFALGIIVKKKFKSLKYPAYPKVGIIANAVGMVFVIIVSFFYLRTYP